MRRGTMAALAVARPFLYVANRVFATRVLHTVLRGESRDRLDLLGEEFFEYFLRPRLKAAGVLELEELKAQRAKIVLVSQGLDHIMRPLANYLGVDYILSNRLDFRDGLATGRLLEPVIRPRGILAKLKKQTPDGKISREQLLRDLGFVKNPDVLQGAIHPARRASAKIKVPVVDFSGHRTDGPFSVRQSLRGKHILLIGSTGFIGKVWLANLLTEAPDIGRISLLIRGSRAATSLARFQRMVEESPVFERLAERHGQKFAAFLQERVEVLDGDVTLPGLGFTPEVRRGFAKSLDLIVNSSGLTDFNPDLRDALAMNVRATSYVLDFLRACDHASLLHLSTSYVVGRRNGRVFEQLSKDYNPAGVRGFRAREEWGRLEALIRETEARAESPEVLEEILQMAADKKHVAKQLTGAALENQIRKNRFRWLRQALTEAGVRRANELGWPNTYTFTKSLAESLIYEFLEESPKAAIAVVRPAIVESSIEKPFLGWNEGINTSASLSYLLGTFFRQLPSNASKCLDLIPVDLVSRGMTLIAAALISRTHERVYHLATSVANPCDMRRSIELTGLGHRKFYRAQNGLHHRLRLRFDAIPVSKARYEKLSAPAQKMIVQIINRSIEPIPFVRSPLVRQERDLERVMKLIALFEPFILENDHVFEAANVERLTEELPPEELATFGYDARSLDWWDYWINVHIPALRKWCYPLIEGRKPESPPKRCVPLVEAGVEVGKSEGAAPAS